MCKLAANQNNDFTTNYPPTAPPLTQPCDDQNKEDRWVTNAKDKDPQFCYLFSTRQSGEQLSWADARDSCRQHGGNLASIHSNDESAFLVSNMMGKDTWMGLNSVYAGKWAWSDGSEVGYYRWENHGKHYCCQSYRLSICNILCLTEPNSGDLLEECVMIYGGSGTWNDRSW